MSFNELFTANERPFLNDLPYVSPEMYARFILTHIKKGLAKEDRERALAYELRERFGFNQMTKFMRHYRETIAAKAAPLRGAIELKKMKALKRKEAALKATATRKIRDEEKKAKLAEYKAIQAAKAAPLRAYAEEKKMKALKRKAAAAKGVETRRLNRL